MEHEIVFWSADNDERLSHYEFDDAVEAVLEEFDKLTSMPETLEVRGYARMQPSPNECWPLEQLLEHLDEEYGDPDGGPTEPTAKMKAAERAFVIAVLEDYEPWACVSVKTEVVNVRQWIQEHRPEWLQ